MGKYIAYKHKGTFKLKQIDTTLQFIMMQKEFLIF